MAITDIDWGTVTLTNGSTTVTGSGTSWIADDIRDGDTFVFVDGGDGFQQPIVASVQSNTELTLRNEWEGPTLTATAYTLRYQWDSSRVSAMSRRLIMLLESGNLEALAALTGPGVAVFNGPHSMEVRPFADFVNGVRFDVQVDALADRDAYDGQVEGFAVLVSDVGDGRSAVFSKNTNTVADWSDPAYVTGPVGDTGPYTDITVGPVTTLPYGQPASVDVVQVDPATIRLDFSIPKGQDGTGTGDMVGPSSSTVNGFVGFADTGGKLTKQLSSAQATAGLDVFEEDTKGLVPAPSSSDVTANRLLQADGTWVDPIVPITDGVVQVDIAQTFTVAQKKQGQDNLGVGMALLASGVLSNATSLDVLLTQYPQYSRFLLKLEKFIPANNDVVLYARTSSNGGSTYDAGASDYLSGGISGNGGGSDSYGGPGTAMTFTRGPGGNKGASNDPARGGVSCGIEFNDPASTSSWFGMECTGRIATPAITSDYVISNGARAVAGKVDAIRILFSSGLITSGSYRLYGLL